MELETLDFPVSWETPPPEILRTIAVAERMQEQLHADGKQQRIALLVNSNYYIAYNALKRVRDSGRDEDMSFCEWGSGLGVVTCIASQLGFSATGIEIEQSLCEFSRALAIEMGVHAKFFQASYRDGLDDSVEPSSISLFRERQRKCEVIYAYPWPAEETLIESLFKRVSTSSSLLMTYHGGTTLRVKKPGMNQVKRDLHRESHPLTRVTDNGSTND